MVKKETREIITVFNEHKLVILQSLFLCPQDQKICGCDLSEKTGLSKDLLSYHLKILRKSGFIKEKKCGRKKQYSLNEKREAIVGQILNLAQMLQKGV